MARRKGRQTAADPLLPGFADLQEIGGGAFATVFQAVELETGRLVALKILKVDTIHAHLLETFQKEIHALAAVSDHPNIVTLYRPTSTTDGRPVLVLELCRESLGQRLRAGGPIGSEEVTRIGIKIAGALETAHRNGFLHRDMKPQNILITQFGEPALADFGVAALQASAQITAGVFGFTTLHAAPEMLEGHHLSPATDIYGLASTMYQLLTGRAPFATFDNEAPASVILRILRDPVRPLRSPDIPFGLADLLERSLSKQPEGRPRTALDFAAALQAVEQAQGWPETTFVAWGSDGPPSGAPPGLKVRGPMGVAVDAPARSWPMDRPGGSPIPAGALPPLMPPAPPEPPSPPQQSVRASVVTPEAGPRRVVDPLGAPAAVPVPPVVPPAVVPVPPAAVPPAGNGSPPTGATPPAPPPQQGLPAERVASPPVPQAGGWPPPTPRVAPWQMGTGRPAPPQPWAGGDHLPFAGTPTLYEQAMGVPARAAYPAARAVPAMAYAGIAAAVAVILVAALLIAGVV